MSADDEINEGDVVRLFSGGPRLTVTAVANNGAATVIWFGEDDALREGSIPVKFLEVAPSCD